uniref:Protein kinase domain-containing protein n=1 Tax=viral metagenome TaxID=1070528 RepID=A0A6C0AFF4_9ZZZZ
MKADMWSIGVIMYLLFYGKMPFDSEKEKDIYNNILIKELSIENTLISGLLKKNPIDRLNSEDSIKLISYLDF